jgi:hypothetical protein
MVMEESSHEIIEPQEVFRHHDDVSDNREEESSWHPRGRRLSKSNRR